jgi:c-di-GMP-binding flagellar brake protein YcgR
MYAGQYSQARRSRSLSPAPMQFSATMPVRLPSSFLPITLSCSGEQKCLYNSFMEHEIQNLTEDIKKYISINEILQVRNMDASDSVTYNSRVNDIAEGKLIVAWPTHRATRLIARRDQMLAFLIMRGEVPHEFSAIVEELDSSARLPQITVIPGESIIRIQRRQNFRAKAMVPVEIAAQIRDPRDDSLTPFVMQTTTLDLSAGGIAIRNPKSFPEDTTAELKLALPDGDPIIKLRCRVVYSEVQADNLLLYRTGMCYLAINERERARIVRYVYRAQLKGIHP